MSYYLSSQMAAREPYAENQGVFGDVPLPGGPRYKPPHAPGPYDKQRPSHYGKYGSNPLPGPYGSPPYPGPWPFGQAPDPGPLTCPPPKWEYNDLIGQCLCAQGYVPTPDGHDCISLVGDDGATGPAGPGPVPTPTPLPPATVPPATDAAACDGTSIGGHCVPTWGLIAGGLVVGVILLKVL